MFRHGDRSSIDTYPTDPNTDKWPDGLGQLSTIGMQQEYGLGAWLAQRYQDFLGTRYTPSEVYYRSDDEDRTLMSAESQLAGLFPPDSTRKFNDSLDWQPIPVHTVELETDPVIYVPSCGKYTKLLNEVMQSDEVQTLAEENAAFFEYLTEHSGKQVDITNLDTIYDPAFCERTHNMTQPAWFNDTLFEHLAWLNDLRWHWRNQNRSLVRFTGGVLSNALLSNMRSAQKPAQAGHGLKLAGFSGHDDNIAAMLHAMQVWNGRAPPYASCLIFELRSLNDEWTVQVLFRNASGSDGLHRLQLPGCSDACSFEQFSQLLSDVALSAQQWTSECADADADIADCGQVLLSRDGDLLSVTLVLTPTMWFAAISVLACLLAVFLGLLVYTFVRLCCTSGKRSRPHDFVYSKLHDVHVNVKCDDAARC